MIVRYKIDLNNPPPLTEEQIKMLDALEQMDDDDIDYSDIPPLTEKQLEEMRRVIEERKKHPEDPFIGKPLTRRIYEARQKKEIALKARSDSSNTKAAR